MRLTSLIGLMLLVQSVICQEALSDLNSEPIIVIRDVHYVDVVTGESHGPVDVRIDDGLIGQISLDIEAEADAMEINGSGLWMIPGLMDAHIHLFQSGGLYTRPDAIDLRDIRPYEQERTWLTDHAADILQTYLSLGITSVIDVGGPMTNYKIRDQYGTKPDLPSYYTTGPLVSTYQPEAFKIDDPPIIKVHTPEEARSEVMKQVPLNPDFIKIWYISLPTMTASTTYDIVAAAIDESHKNNLRVAVHATQLNTAKLALKAGADILVHSVSDPIDDEFVSMLLARNVVLIPTLVVHGNYDLAFSSGLALDETDLALGQPEVIGSLLEAAYIDHPSMVEARIYAPPMIERNKKADEIRRTNLKKLADAGVIIATGTDAGNIGTLHGTSYDDEIEAMRMAGLSHAAILKASTIGGAYVVQRQEETGSIETGKQADLLLLRGNPLEDLSALKDIAIVVKNGSIVDTDKFKSRSPVELVQMQLNAYNLGKIDAFLEPYSDSVRVFNFPNELLYTGKDIMRNNYASFFESTPDLHCKLVNRIVEGNTVIDQEHVTGLNRGGEINAVAIYKIRNGKVQEVYFDRGR